MHRKIYPLTFIQFSVSSKTIPMKLFFPLNLPSDLPSIHTMVERSSLVQGDLVPLFVQLDSGDCGVDWVFEDSAVEFVFRMDQGELTPSFRGYGSNERLTSPGLNWEPLENGFWITDGGKTFVYTMTSVPSSDLEESVLSVTFTLRRNLVKSMSSLVSRECPGDLRVLTESKAFEPVSKYSVSTTRQIPLLKPFVVLSRYAQTDQKVCIAITIRNLLPYSITLKDVVLHLNHSVIGGSIPIDLSKSFSESDESDYPIKIGLKGVYSIVKQLTASSSIADLSSEVEIETPITYLFDCISSEYQESKCIQWKSHLHEKVTVHIDSPSCVPLYSDFQIQVKVQSRFEETKSMSLEIGETDSDKSHGMVCQEKIVSLGYIEGGKSKTVKLTAMALEQGMLSLGRISVKIWDSSIRKQSICMGTFTTSRQCYIYADETLETALSS